jgi:hypothetical protein
MWAPAYPNGCKHMRCVALPHRDTKGSSGQGQLDVIQHRGRGQVNNKQGVGGAAHKSGQSVMHEQPDAAPVRERMQLARTHWSLFPQVGE